MVRESEEENVEEICGGSDCKVGETAGWECEGQKMSVDERADGLATSAYTKSVGSTTLTRASECEGCHVSIRLDDVSPEPAGIGEEGKARRRRRRRRSRRRTSRRRKRRRRRSRRGGFSLNRRRLVSKGGRGETHPGHQEKSDGKIIDEGEQPERDPQVRTRWQRPCEARELARLAVGCEV